MNYNYKDILWAPAKGFSAKKILVMSVYLSAALMIYDIFTYIALAFEGEKFKTVFSVYTFFPFYKYAYDNVIAQVFFTAGLVLTTLTVMMGMAGVAKIEYEALRGNRFYPPGATFSFTFARLKQIVLAEAGMIFFVLFLALLYFLFGLISRIPFVGDWLYAIFFLIPNFIIAIIGVFVMFMIAVSVFLLPSAAIVDNKAEAFQAILETFSTILRRPVHWAVFTAYSLGLAKIYSFVYAYFCYRAVEFSVAATALGGGSGINKLTKQALALLPYKSDVADFFTFLYPGSEFGFSLADNVLRSSGGTVSYLLAFMLFLIFVTVVGYFFSALTTTQLRGYLVIRYLKDRKAIDPVDNDLK